MTPQMTGKISFLSFDVIITVIKIVLNTWEKSLMAKLYFRYGAMGSSKSANILMVRYNYEERGQFAILLKPKTDNRNGKHIIKSRIGLSADALYVDEFLSDISDIWHKGLSEYTYNDKTVSAILVDEAQF